MNVGHGAMERDAHEYCWHNKHPLNALEVSETILYAANKLCPDWAYIESGGLTIYAPSVGSWMELWPGWENWNRGS